MSLAYGQRGTPIKPEKKDLGEVFEKIYHDLFPHAKPVTLFHLPDIKKSIAGYLNYCKVKMMELYGVDRIDELPEYVLVAMGEKEVDTNVKFSFDPAVITHMSVTSMFRNDLVEELDVKWAGMSEEYYKEERYAAYPVLLWVALN